MADKQTRKDTQPRIEALERREFERRQIDRDLLFKDHLIMSSSGVIATADLDGYMTFGNPSFLKTWGFDSIEEVVGRHFSEFWIAGETLDEVMGELRIKGQWFGEIKARRKDDSLFDVQVSAAIVYDPEGNPLALTSTSIDVTDRKLMEKALRDSELKHKTLVNNIPGMVYRAYPDWSAEIISGSEAICEFTEKELNSKEENWLSLVHHDDKEGVLKAGSELTLAQKNIVQIYRIKTKGDDIRWVEDRKTSIFSDTGDFVGIDGIVFDITARKGAEEALLRERDKLKDALSKIKTLSGMLPICASCKKIRDDNGYWNQIENYIREHSEAEFSHGLCPECAQKLYPDLGLGE